MKKVKISPRGEERKYLVVRKDSPTMMTTLKNKTFRFWKIVIAIAKEANAK